MNNKTKTLLSIALLLLLGNYIFPGLLPGTMILVDNSDNYRKIEELRAGDRIVVFNILDDQVESKIYEIEKIKSRKSNKFIILRANGIEVAFGSKQKIFNSTILKFVPISDLKEGDTLYSPGIGNLKIEVISHVKLEKKIKLYDIAIKDGNIFMARTRNGPPLLMHNFAVVVPILTFTLGGKIAFVGISSLASAIAASLAINHFKNREYNVTIPPPFKPNNSYEVRDEYHEDDSDSD